jgi:hypothetical protein
MQTNENTLTSKLQITEFRHVVLNTCSHIIRWWTYSIDILVLQEYGAAQNHGIMLFCLSYIHDWLICYFLQAVQDSARTRYGRKGYAGTPNLPIPNLPISQSPHTVHSTSSSLTYHSLRRFRNIGSAGYEIVCITRRHESKIRNPPGIAEYQQVHSYRYNAAHTVHRSFHVFQVRC